MLALRRQIVVCAIRTHRRDGARRSSSLYLSWVTDGEMEAQGGRRRQEPWVPQKERAGVCLSLEKLTWGGECGLAPWVRIGGGFLGFW